MGPIRGNSAASPPIGCGGTTNGGAMIFAVMIELRETEIDVLVRKGLLNQGRRDDRSAIVPVFCSHPMIPKAG